MRTRGLMVGISNTNQFLLGLNPTNPASVFRILNFVPQSNNVVITWATEGGTTNAVQATAGGPGGATPPTSRILAGQFPYQAVMTRRTIISTSAARPTSPPATTASDWCHKEDERRSAAVWTRRQRNNNNRSRVHDSVNHPRLRSPFLLRNKFRPLVLGEWLSSRAFAPLLPSRIAGTLTFSALRGSHRKAVQKQRNATPVPIHQRGCVAPPCCQATRRRQSMKRVFSEWPAMVAGRKSYGKCRVNTVQLMIGGIQ
jgi:hypothetical protein